MQHHRLAIAFAATFALAPLVAPSTARAQCAPVDEGAFTSTSWCMDWAGGVPPFGFLFDWTSDPGTGGVSSFNHWDRVWIRS